MHVDNDKLLDSCDKLQRLAKDISFTGVHHFGFTGLMSGLVSVQSFFEQVNEFADGDNGFIAAVTWHAEEAVCISNALRQQCAAVSTADDVTAEDFKTAYLSVARENGHQASCPSDANLVGGTLASHSGHEVKGFVNNSRPITEEPPQHIHQLAAEFAKFDPTAFWERAAQWEEISDDLQQFADDVCRVSADISAAGSPDAFTHSAGEGIKIWANSVRVLGEQAKRVSEHVTIFADNYAPAAVEINHIADRDIREHDQAIFSNTPYDPSECINEANGVLLNKYNPGLAQADTRSIEIPIPVRALVTEHYPSAPLVTPTQPAPPNGTLNPPNITANPNITTPTPSQPVISPPDTNDIHEVTPPAGMPPAETKPNIVDPVVPGDGRGVGPVGGPSRMTPGGASPHVPPAATNPATTGPAGTQTPQPGGVPISGYLGRWNNPSHGSNDNRENRPNSNVVIGAGGISTGVGAGVGAGVGVGVGAGSAIRSGGATGNTGAVPGLGAKGAGAAGTNPNTPSGSGAETATGVGPSAKAGAGASGTGNGAGGRPGMGGMPGAPGAGAGDSKSSKGKPRRSRRSAENTERILPQPGNLPRGIIRHPDDPLYGTGR